MGLFRRLFGAKKSGHSPKAKDKRRWSFATRSSNPASSDKRDPSLSPYEDGSLDASKHAIAVAAATAAVAEAALAAAQAAAEVVRLTSGGGGGAGVGAVAGGGGRSVAAAAPAHGSVSHRQWAEQLAAVKIQSAFRSYLARRALRALKALVKLQALVRGHIVRKQTADMLRRMQTLVRLQARARATRAHPSESRHSASKSSHSRNNIVPTSPQKNLLPRAYSTKFDGPSILKRCGSNSNFRDIIDLDKAKQGSNWLDRWMEESIWNSHGNGPLRNRRADDEKSDKILEVDTWKPHMRYQQSSRTFQTPQHVLVSDHYNQGIMASDSPSKLSTKAQNPMPSVSSGEVLSFNSLKLPAGKDEAVFRTAENSPHVYSSSSRPGSSSGKRGPFTPTRSEGAWGFLNGYTGYPNYMANTESSRAKIRSQSAPRQRIEFEKYGSSRSVQGFPDDTRSEKGFAQRADFKNTAYAVSGRLSRLESTNLR